MVSRALHGISSTWIVVLACLSEHLCVLSEPFESQGERPHENAAASWVSFTSKCALTFYEKGVLLYENISLVPEAENPSRIGCIMIEFYSIERDA